MRHARPLILLATLLAPATLSAPATAAWPPAADLSREDLARPENWPNDPEWAVDERRRGQWYSFSWIPEVNRRLPGFRREELALGSGNNVDAAWQLTIGDPRVLIAVLDSGIEWDDPDLLLKAAINPGELPRPQDASGTTREYDANGDGVFNVADYLDDPRIPCGTAMPHPLRACRGADGMPNDPNRNGVFDAGDLIRVFSDGTDGDANGYVDDISGWDFFKDDNDPYDDTRFGHGTGEAHDSSSETNNGIGQAGVCPRCLFVPLRVGDSFVTDVNDFAQASVYATDLRYHGNRVRVIQEALGTINNSTFAMQAIDYAYEHGVVVMASAADENSRHHNMPGTNNHTVYVHAVRYNENTLHNSTSFLAFNNCTNYGGQLQLSVAGLNCSSQATGESSGIAGLIYSEALSTSLSPELSAEEVRQLLVQTADDIDVPESRPGSPNYNPVLYPSLPGWDQRFGYGRTNARRAVEWVRDRRIPPEVDITSPRWFTVLHADRAEGRRLVIEGRIAARRAPRFDYVVEWAPGIEPGPGETAWQAIRRETNVTAPVTNRLAELDLTNVTVNNPGEVENRFAITVRIRAVAHYDAPVGDVPGEVRRVFYVHRDPDLLPGFPLDTRASDESSPRLVDLNGDGRREIVVVTSDGLVHAYRADGTELAGFPVHTNLDLGFDPARTPSYRGAPAYSGETPAIDPDRLYETVLGTPAVVDLDGDRDLEIVVTGYHGTVYVWNHDGTPYGHGFPRRLPDVPSEQTSPRALLDRGIFGSPVVYDLNGDGRREIIFGAFDGNLYALDSATAADHPGFPVAIHIDDPMSERNRVFGSVGVGNFDGDGIPDLVVVTNERLPNDPNTGAVFLVHGDGNRHAGGPYHPNWPVGISSLNLLPLVGQGVPSSPPIADVDGDGRDELALTGTGSATIVIARGAQGRHNLLPEPRDIAQLSTLATGIPGPLSNSRVTPRSFIVAFSLGSFADLTGDGNLEFVMSGASISLALSASGARRGNFEHLLGAWDARTGAAVPGFPRVIEDYTFFANATAADVSGDAYAEALIGTGGYYLHAADACGREAPGFPKFTGQWIIPAAAVGDLDGDGGLEVVTGTRSGYVYAWRTRGRDTGVVQWPTFRHDNANTGNYGTALEFGTRRAEGAGPITCPTSQGPDAGMGDDAGTDAGGPNVRAGGGCGCRTAGGETSGTPAVLALGALGAALARRRRTR
jgi:MYXO-CTERM domain-containing protein